MKSEISAYKQKIWGLTNEEARYQHITSAAEFAGLYLTEINHESGNGSTGRSIYTPGAAQAQGGENHNFRARKVAGFGTNAYQYSTGAAQLESAIKTEGRI